MELHNIQKEKIKNISYHVFQVLDTEKKSEYYKCQKNMAELKYNVDILKEYGVLKSKIKNTKIPERIPRKKLRTITRRKTRLLRNRSCNNDIENSNNSMEKLLNKNYYIQSRENEENNNAKNKSESIKKHPIKIKKFTKRNLDINEDNNNKNSDEIFITKLMTENNVNDNKTNRYTDYIRNTERYNNNKSYSLNNYLPPINNKRSLLNQKYNIKSNNYSNNNLNNINDKYSYINELINEDNKTFDNKKKDNFFNYSVTEGSSKKRKNMKYLSVNENIALKMIRKNKHLINNIKKVKNNIEEANIDFETKFKYFNWKYGISDTNKYFIDIEAYRKNEEELINRRKSFYDRLDDVIDDIKKKKELKNLQVIAKRFGIKFVDDDDNKKDKDIEDTDKIFLKEQEVKNSLKELYQRQNIEKVNRDKINKILDRSKDKFNIIRAKLNKYRANEKKLKEFYN